LPETITDKNKEDTLAGRRDSSAFVDLAANFRNIISSPERELRFGEGKRVWDASGPANASNEDSSDDIGEENANDDDDDDDDDDVDMDEDETDVDSPEENNNNDEEGEGDEDE